MGQDTLRDGEVRVSFQGTSDLAGMVRFDSDDLRYSIKLPPGEYDVYAWAPVFHNSDRSPFSLGANETVWVNITLVRIEEVRGTVTDEHGEPVEGALVEFRSNGSLNASVPTSDEGAFRDTIPPGEYVAAVTKRGYHPLEREFTLGRGQVLTLDLTIAAEPGGEGAELPWMSLLVGVFIFGALGLSLGFVTSQARKARRAAAEAEAKRTRDIECPECGARVPPGRPRCPECHHHFQVRCDECGRLMDAGTGECPECGAPTR